MPEPAALPVIVEPFSAFGDEIAGHTADEIGRNLAAATRTSLAWRCRPRRPCPDVWAAFDGHRLTPAAQADLREVAAVYTRLTLRRQATLAPAGMPSADDHASAQRSLL